MKLRPASRLWPAAFLLAFMTVEAALAAGGFAFTKRLETKLLAEPKPFADAVGKLAFGRKVKIEQVQGAWWRVSDGPDSGWVFAGNLSETKPAEVKGLDGVALTASATTATAAARPLTPAADDYAARRNLVNARDDLNWLLEQCRTFTPEELAAFLQARKKGEYQ